MRTLACFLVLLASVAAAPTRDAIREVIHPAAETPAFRCLIPADWRNEVDAVGNLLLSNPKRTANFALGFAHSSDPSASLDTLAKAILATAITAPWDAREPAEISGFRGFRYSAHVRPQGDGVFQAEVVLVVVDDKHIASCSMLLDEKLPRDDETKARLVQAAVKLLAPH